MCVVGAVCSEGWDLCGHSSSKKPHSHSHQEVCVCVCAHTRVCVCVCVLRLLHLHVGSILDSTTADYLHSQKN